MQLQITPKRALAAIGLVLVYIALGIALVRQGSPMGVGVVLVLAGILLGLGVALTRRR